MVLRPHKKTQDITCAGQVEKEKIKYEAHTDVVCGKIAGKLKHLEALQGKASFKTLKEVTVSLIHSTIEFCTSFIWLTTGIK